MVKIHKYNFKGISEYDVGQVLINSIVEKLENSIYDVMPKQNYVIQKLKQAGWEKK